MYQLKFLVSLLSLLFITSCSSDDDGVVGSWVLANVDLTSCPSDISDANIDAENGCVFILEESLCLDMSFTEDGIVVIRFSYDDDAPEAQAGTYTENGDAIEICFDGDCQNITLKDNELTLSSREDGCNIAYNFKKG